MKSWINILILLCFALTCNTAVAGSTDLRQPEKSFCPVTVKYDVERVWKLAGLKKDAVASNGMDYKTLLDLLKDESTQIRRLVAYVLGEIGNKEAVEPLAARLKDPDAHVRRIAAWSLGKINDRRAVMPLIEILCCPKETRHVQCAAANSLGRLSDQRAVRLLEYLRENETGRLKRSASISLMRIAPEIYIASE